MPNSMSTGFLPPESNTKPIEKKANPHDLYYTSAPPKREPISSPGGGLDFTQMTIGDRIRYLRIESGYQQTEIAAKTGLSQAAVSNFENNLLTPGNKDGLMKLRQPRGVTLTKLALELGTTPEWLMSGHGDPKWKLQTRTTDEDELAAIISRLSPEKRKLLTNLAKQLDT
jgi:transcriptional regulator with XRE-family HTH domain